MSKADLTSPQIKCLRSVLYHGDPYHDCRGRSEHGGRGGTISHLRLRGLIGLNTQGWYLSEAGKAALAAIKGE